MPKSTITDFFPYKKKGKNFVESASTSVAATNSAQFYQSCLNEQKESCTKRDCIVKKDLLKNQVDQMKEKCSEIENAIRICESVMSEKYVKIKDLEQEINKSVRIHSVDSNVISANSASGTQKFNRFSMDFTSEKLANLRSIGPDKREDSTFVSATIKALYAGRLDVIKNKSLTGRSKTEQQKESITPEKRKIINDIFTEQIQSLTGDENERQIRITKVNKHIRFALINISRKIQQQTIENAVCQRLAETEN